jgi:hypothetical protein
MSGPVGPADKATTSTRPPVETTASASGVLTIWRSAATRAALSPEERRNPDLD